MDVTAIAIKAESKGIKEAATALDQLATSAEKAEKKVHSLEAAMEKLNAVNRLSTQSMQQTMGGAAALATAMAALTSAIEKLSPKVNTAEVAQRKHTEAMREAHAVARGLSGALGALWVTYGNFAGMAVGIALGASLKNILQIGMEVEKQLNFVFALSEKGQKVNLDKFLSITGASVQSVTDAANAMRMLAQNGLDVTQSLSALPHILNLAAIGEMNVGQAAIAATGAAAAFGLQMSEVERVADVFAMTAARSNTSVLAMTESMKQASTVGAMFGLTIEETAGFLGLLAKLNITGGAAGTALTQMLTGLYEPTEQAKKAMERLGVSAFDLNGKAKNSIVLLEDIKRASADLSDKTKNDIFGAMVTQRGMKVLVQSIENIDVLKGKITELEETAEGFNKKTVAKLENDTAHAFKRMAIIIETEFTMAFAAAQPHVQALARSLGDLFKGSNETRKNELTGELERTTSAIGNLVSNLAIFANALVENAQYVAGIVVAYALWRAAVGYTIASHVTLGVTVTTLGGAYKAWGLAVAASTAASVVHANAIVAQGVAQATGSGITLANTAVVEANTAATLAATTAQRAFMAFLLPALGFLAVAIAAAAALWLVFRDNTSDVADANARMSNTIETIGEQLDKEQARLKRSIDLWDERKKAFRDDGTVTRSMQQEAAATALFAQRALNEHLASGGGTANPIKAVEYTIKLVQLTNEANKAKQAIDDINKSIQTQASNKFDLPFEKLGQDVVKLKKETQAFFEEASKHSSKGKDDFYIKNIAERNLRLKEGAEILSKISALETGISNKSVKDMEAARATLKTLEVDLANAKKAVNDTHKTLATPTPKNEVNDAYNASIKKQDEIIKASKRDLTAFEQQQNTLQKAGELGRIEVIENVAQRQIESHKKIKDALEEEMRLVKAKKDQTGVARVDGALTQNDDELTNRKIQNAANLSAVLADFEKQNTENHYRELELRGQHAEAASEKAKALFEASIKSEERAFANLTKQFVEGWTSGAEGMDVVLKKMTILTAHISGMKTAAAAMVDAGANKQAVSEFNVLAEATRNSLRGIQTASEGLGLGAMFDAATAASAKLANNMGDLKDRFSKITETKDINEAQAQLINLAETQRKMWQGVGESISKSLGDAFGEAGKAGGEMIQVLVKSSQTQDKLEVDRKQAIKERTGLLELFGATESEISQENAKISEQYAAKERSMRIKSYGDMAGAAKNFFKEGSTGYKVLEAAEKAFRLIELAGIAKSMIANLLSDKTKEASETSYTLTSLAKGAIRLAQKAVEAVMNQAGGDPYTAFARMAAMAAVVAGLGYAVAGAMQGGGSSTAPMSAEDRQKAAGAGSVLGDDDAKSESIANSLEILEKNSGLGLVHSSSMVNSLKNIEQSMVGVTSLVLQSGVGKAASVDGQTNFDKLNDNGLAKLSDPLLKISSKIVNSIFGGKKSVIDSGINLGGGSLAEIMSGGISGKSYTDVKTEGGWFSKDKFNTDSKALSDEVNKQFTGIILSMRDAITAGANSLGLGGTEFTKKLDAFVVEIGAISLKDMTGEEIQKQFEAIFSKLGDDMTKSVLGGLSEFQKVGEGMLETLARVSNGLVQVQDVFAVLNTNFTMTGLAAIKVSEELITAAGGLDKLTGNTKYFVENFLTKAEQMAPIIKSVENRMSELGVGSVKTAGEFKDLILAQSKLAATGEDNMLPALLELAPAFKQSADYAKELAEGTVELTKEEKKDQEIKKKQHELDLRLMEAQGLGYEAVKIRRQDEYAELAKLNPKLAETAELIDNLNDKNLVANKARSLQMELLDALGDKEGALAMRRADVLTQLDSTFKGIEGAAEALRNAQVNLWAVQDNAASDKTKRGLAISLWDQRDAQIGTTIGRDAKREDTITGLGKDTEAIRLQRQVWAEADFFDARTKAAAEYNSVLDLQARLYAANGDAVGAATVLEKQRSVALLALTPALQKATKETWAAEDAEKARAKALAESVTILDLQAEMYAANGDKVGAATVLEAQRAAALKLLTPAVAEQTKLTWAAVDAEKARSAALAEANTLLDLEGQLYAITGDKIGAANVLQQQHAAALLLLTPAVAKATQAVWDATAAQKAKEEQEVISKKFAEMELTLFNLTHTAAEQLANKRQLELAAMDATYRPLQMLIYQAEDLATAAAKAAEVLQQRTGLELTLYNLTHNAVEVLANKRRLELLTIDASNVALQLQIYAAEDLATATAAATEASKAAEAAAKEAAAAAAAAEKEAADRWASIMKERAGLELTLYNLTHNAVEILANKRRLELLTIDSVNVALQLQIYAAEDFAAASAAAAEATKAAADKLAAIATERTGLELTLYNLTHTAVEVLNNKRRLELATIDISNIALQRQIYAAEDAATAATAAASAQEEYNSTLEKHKSNLKEAYEREASVFKSTMERFKAYEESLRKFGQTLVNGAAALLSPEAQYRANKQEFERVSALARSGNEVAIGELQGVSEEYLKSSKDYFASSQGYFNDLEAVKNAVEDARASSDSSVDIAQLQLDALTSLVSGYVDINESVLSVADAIRELIAATVSAAVTPVPPVIPATPTLPTVPSLPAAPVVTAPPVLPAAPAVPLPPALPVAPVLPPTTPTGISGSAGNTGTSSLSGLAGIPPSLGGQTQTQFEGGMSAGAMAFFRPQPSNTSVPDPDHPGFVTMYGPPNFGLPLSLEVAKWTKYITDKDQYFQDHLYNILKFSGISGEIFDQAFGGGYASMLADNLQYPHFRNGGDHTGGFAMVGEDGPELVGMGASRVFNANTTKDILNNEEVVELLKEVAEELRKLNKKSPDSPAAVSLLSGVNRNLSNIETALNRSLAESK